MSLLTSNFFFKTRTKRARGSKLSSVSRVGIPLARPTLPPQGVSTRLSLTSARVWLSLLRLRCLEGVPAASRQRASGQANPRRHHQAGPAARDEGGRDSGVRGNHHQDHPVFLRAAAAFRGVWGAAWGQVAR